MMGMGSGSPQTYEYLVRRRARYTLNAGSINAVRRARHKAQKLRERSIPLEASGGCVGVLRAWAVNGRGNSSESLEQQALVAWARLQSSDARLIFAIPNGGLRSQITGARLKKEGVIAGIPDLFLPVPRGSHGGLFIEMKTKSGRMTSAQQQWALILTAQGYAVSVCRGWDAARVVIEEYLEKRSL